MAIAPHGSPAARPSRAAWRWNERIAASRWAVELRAPREPRWARYARRSVRDGGRQSTPRASSQSRYAPTAVAYERRVFGEASLAARPTQEPREGGVGRGRPRSRVRRALGLAASGASSEPRTGRLTVPRGPCRRDRGRRSGPAGRAPPGSAGRRQAGRRRGPRPPAAGRPRRTSGRCRTRPSSPPDRRRRRGTPRPARSSSCSRTWGSASTPRRRCRCAARDARRGGRRRSSGRRPRTGAARAAAGPPS